MLLDFSPFSFSLWKHPGVATIAKKGRRGWAPWITAPTSLPRIQYTDPIGSRIQQKDGRQKPWCNSQPLQAPQCSAALLFAMVQDAPSSLRARLLDKQTPLGTSKEALGTPRNVLTKVTAARSIANPREESARLISRSRETVNTAKCAGADVQLQAAMLRQRGRAERETNLLLVQHQP